MEQEFVNFYRKSAETLRRMEIYLRVRTIVLMAVTGRRGVTGKVDTPNPLLQYVHLHTEALTVLAVSRPPHLLSRDDCRRFNAENFHAVEHWEAFPALQAERL